MCNICRTLVWSLKRFWWIYFLIFLVTIILMVSLSRGIAISFAFCSFLINCIFFIYNKTPSLKFEFVDCYKWGDVQIPTMLRITNYSSSPINIVKIDFFDNATKKAFDYLTIPKNGIRIDQNQIECFNINTKFEIQDTGHDEIPNSIKIVTSDELTQIYKIYSD
nr:MAG TPA: hypothetical protein [Caudoviricetes sp.]